MTSLTSIIKNKAGVAALVSLIALTAIVGGIYVYANDKPTKQSNTNEVQAINTPTPDLIPTSTPSPSPTSLPTNVAATPVTKSETLTLHADLSGDTTFNSPYKITITLPSNVVSTSIKPEESPNRTSSNSILKDISNFDRYLVKGDGFTMTFGAAYESFQRGYHSAVKVGKVNGKDVYRARLEANSNVRLYSDYFSTTQSCEAGYSGVKHPAPCGHYMMDTGYVTCRADTEAALKKCDEIILSIKKV